MCRFTLHMAYFVYILECSDGTYYTGMTNDLDRRMMEHKSGYYPNSYTHERRPVELKWYGTFTSVTYAIEKEKQLKSWSKAKKLALIANDWSKVSALAKKDFGKKKS